MCVYKVVWYGCMCVCVGDGIYKVVWCWCGMGVCGSHRPVCYQGRRKVGHLCVWYVCVRVCGTCVCVRACVCVCRWWCVQGCVVLVWYGCVWITQTAYCRLELQHTCRLCFLVERC